VSSAKLKMVNIFNSTITTTIFIKMEGLIELFCDWYNVTQPQLRRVSALNNDTFEDLWVNKWFAKKEKQVYMDKYLRKYESLFDIDYDTFICDVQPEYALIINISFMILWDQASRNIYRNTKKAYETDAKARIIVESIMKHWDRLPIAIKISCVLVYIHSENIDDLLITTRLLNEISKSLSLLPSIQISLLGIAKNHSDRMKYFGRIPERNKFLGRESTEAEIAYMSIL